MNNPYEILGISQNATDDEIKKSYRKIAKATHPDLNGGDTSKINQFRDATEAYKFLLDKDRRAQYDYFMSTSEQEAQHAYESYSESNENDSVDFQEIIQKMVAEIKNAQSQARIKILPGIVMLIIGVAITSLSYFFADVGEHYRIYWGIMILGGIGAVKSLFSYISLRSKVKEYESDMWIHILGHSPTEKDEDYVSYMKIVHSAKEKLKSAIVIIFALVSVIGMCVFGFDIVDGEIDGLGNSYETVDAVQSKEQRLYDELVQLSDEVTDMESKLSDYEKQLRDLEDEYNKAPSDELYSQYKDLYAEYEQYYNEYEEKNSEFKEKYSFFDKTYGFDESE